MIDQPTSIRKGEELDLIRLQNYLKVHLEVSMTDMEVSQFPSGFSNLTYLIKTSQREFVLRRPPFGAEIKGGHDMHREFNVLSLLKPVYPAVPKPELYCADESVLGAPFYLMERVKGVILRGKPPGDLALPPRVMKSISEACIDNLISLHQMDLTATGLADLGKPDGYTQRQVEGWISRYYRAETDKLQAMDEVADWLQKNRPEQRYVSFIHNDYKYDNLVLNPEELSEITAVLDWEMSTVGNPLMDLGTSLGYWAEPGDSDALKPFSLTWLPGNLTRKEVVMRYGENTGFDVTDIVFYYAFGAFKIAVIIQQIYARYKRGLTKDRRFANLVYAVMACAENAREALNKDSI